MTEREQADRLLMAVSSGDHVTALLTAILERQDSILDKVECLDNRITEADAKLDGHMAREEGLIGEFFSALPVLPNGKPDVDGHRSYHQSLIEEAQDRAKMWRELRTEIIKKGTWGILMVITALVVYWWNGEVKK